MNNHTTPVDLTVSLNSTEKWIEVYGSLVDGLEFETSYRSVISTSLLHLSIEHQNAIYVLIRHGSTIGSAFALIRPQFEAYVRGVWFHCCANDKDIESFIAGKNPPRIDQLITDIEKTPGFKHGELKCTKVKTWKFFNDFTHGGLYQIKSRSNGNEIKGVYSEEDIVHLLDASSHLSLLTSIEMSGIASNEELATKLLYEYGAIYPQEQK